MSRFNYAKEKAEFDRKWAILEKEYRSAGMPEADIQEMHDYDFGIFKRRRSWATYETPLSELLPDDECIEEMSIESPTVSNDLIAEDTYALVSSNARFFWMNQIANPQLLDLLTQITEMNLCILTAYVFEGKSQKEIAEYYGISQQKVSARLCRMKKFFEKNYGGRV